MNETERKEWELFSKFVDDKADLEVKESLGGILENEKSADNFLLFMLDHVALRGLHREKAFSKHIELELNKGNASQTLPLKWRVAKNLGTHAIAAAVAASVAIICLFSFQPEGFLRDTPRSANSKPSTQDNHLAVDAGGEPRESLPVVATLSGIVDCVWSDDFAVKPYASSLVSGDVLALSEGIAQITFESGAKVVVEGPCDFKIVDAMSSELEFGKLAALAPDSASGFEVLTPSSRVIDIGTEFGVSVDSLGASDIHVFKGEVVTSGIEAFGEAITKVSLKTNEGMAYRRRNNNGVRIPAQSTKFQFGVEDRLHKDRRPDTPIVEGLAMWLQADTGVVLDLNNRVRAWQDVLVGDNISADDAMQPADYARPAYRSSGLNGRPSVRFDGRSSFLMTPPMASTKNQTITVVASFSEANSGSGQLLSYNGPPKLILDRPVDNGYIEINAYGNDSLIYNPVLFAGFDGPDPVNTGVIFNSTDLKHNQAYILTYRYDHDSNQSDLIINGRRNGSSDARVSAAVTSRRVIGKHGLDGNYYAGDISEILVWDRSLSDAELDEINEHLTDLYLK